MIDIDALIKKPERCKKKLCIFSKNQENRDADLIVKCPNGLPSLVAAHEIQACVCNCQETVSKRVEQWGVLVEVWWYDMHARSTIFCSIGDLTQLAILNVEQLFDVEYKDSA